MKIWTISDIHLKQREALDLMKPDRFPDADVCVIAGDICNRYNLSLNWAAKVIRPRMPVVFVMGNHEFYSASLQNAQKNARMLAKSLGITFLDDNEAVIGGVRFLGSTLWTDFALFVGNDSPISIERAMAIARVSMADYGETTVLDYDRFRQMQPQDTLMMHQKSLAFLEAAFAEGSVLPTVVVTHHGPHRGSVHARYATDDVTPAFVSDLSDQIARWRPLAWIHGHVHSCFDYVVGGTRIVCNPRGYQNENPDFDFHKVIEIAA